MAFRLPASLLLVFNLRALGSRPVAQIFSDTQSKAFDRPTPWRQTARNQIFNCVGDRAVTLDGMARLCAAAAGVDKPTIVHYNPKKARVCILFLFG